MYKYLNEKFINTTFKTKIELYILTLLMFYLFYFFYTKIDFFENKASVEKIRLKNNGKIYRHIEKELFVGMFKLVKERISR